MSFCASYQRTFVTCGDVTLFQSVYVKSLILKFEFVQSNTLIFQLIPPALKTETSLDVLKEYGNLLNFVCCLISRKSIIIRKANFCRNINVISDFNSVDMDDIYSKEIVNVEMSNYFELLCTCCDKKRIDAKILPKLTKRRKFIGFA